MRKVKGKRERGMIPTTLNDLGNLYQVAISGELGTRQGGHTTTHASKTASWKALEKVLRSVLRSRLAMGFRGNNLFLEGGSEKGTSRSYSEGRSTPICRVGPLKRAP